MLTQQFAFSACATTGAVCGTPLIGGLLYFYQIGTVATPQNSYQDTGLTIPNPWPLVLDSNGRVPVFYLASGSIHVRLTDAAGVVQFDTNSLVIGPSGGGGGGGPSVDPTSIASTGDIKFRATAESNVTVPGWVWANGQTIGNAVSGAATASAATQALFIYLWTNCPDAHCTVSGGRTASALADFNANKTITVFDLRARTPVGLDNMGATAAGRLLASNVTSGGGDGPTTPNATGGEANHTLITAETPTHNHTITDPGHNHSTSFTQIAGSTPGVTSANNSGVLSLVTGTSTTGITINNTGGGGAHNNMSPFVLGSFYIKL
jgi:microcystin-dependent protein